MKAIDEYLEREKIKALGLDDREPQLTTVKKYDGSEKVKLAAVRRNGYAIKFIKNPTDKVILEAVKQDKRAIGYIDIDSLNEETKEMLMYLL